MLALGAGTRVYLACKPVSMRKGVDGLAALTREVFDADPFSGHLFLFRGKAADYFKVIYWDGSGVCLFAKRLEKGRFVWPPLVDGGVVLTPAQLTLLVEGIDWRRTVVPPPPTVPPDGRTPVWPANLAISRYNLCTVEQQPSLC